MNPNRPTNGPDRGHGPPHVQLRIQTPRGLWSMTEPATATKHPDYPISTPVQQVVDDVREVFRFTEGDNRYTLMNGQTMLEPQRPLASYNLDQEGLVLLFTVQGGNA